MKLLSLHQPFASLMAEGHKTIETRGWQTPYRGPVAIHASQGVTEDDWRCATGSEFIKALYPAYGPCQVEDWIDVLRKSLPFGKIIAVGILIDCRPTSKGDMPTSPASVFAAYPDRDTPAERAFGNYDPGRYGWVFAHVTKLPKPILYRGMVGLTEVKTATVAEIMAQFPTEVEAKEAQA